MSKRGENIYKRKDGRWEGRYIKEYQQDGKPKYGYIYGKTYSEAKKKLLEARMAKENQKACNRKNVLYEDVLMSWLAISRLRIKESTYARYWQLVSDHIQPQLGKYTLEQLKTSCVEQYVIHLLSHGRLDGKGGLSPKTVSDIVVLVKGSLDYATYSGYSVNCNLKKIVIKKKQTEMRVLSLSEQRSLLNVLLSNTDLPKLGVLICLFTGLRIGEVCALKWKCIDLEKGTLYVLETLQRIKNTNPEETNKTKVILTEPKSRNSRREIPLPSFLVVLIRRFEQESEAYVLTGREDKYFEPRSLQYWFKKYVKESGLEGVNYHALRHTFATRCIELGFDPKTLSEILGHTNVNITLNRYVHSSMQAKRTNMERLHL